MAANNRRGTASVGIWGPTAFANAKPDAECPDGKDDEWGILV